MAPVLLFSFLAWLNTLDLTVSLCEGQSTELHLFSHPKPLEDPQTFSAIPNFRELTLQDLGVVFLKSPFWGFRWKIWDLPHLFLPSWERLGISTNGCMHPQSLQLCLTLCDPVDCSPPGSSVHKDYPVKNAGVGCHALLQAIFLTQGLNPCLLHLLHWLAGSLPLGPPGYQWVFSEIYSPYLDPAYYIWFAWGIEELLTLRFSL